jgi:hypothetical protein
MRWSVIGGRLADLAMRFFENADDSIMTGFRRLEDLIRQRTGLWSGPSKNQVSRGEAML